ncbi:alpha/beta hydrolase [Microbacterium insulae]|uniref:Alpha/beta hydrolase n=1 Tax=Microbacterium insulae TaxID=483014 RepID=A0ABW3AHH0_9MICO
MDLERVDPSLRDATRRVPVLDLEGRHRLRLIATLSRLAPGKRIAGVDRRIVRRGPVRVRVHTPPAPTGAGLLWVHGGGLVLGSAAMDDRMSAETAVATGAVVVSVDYRLAPKHPFPVPLDDCAAAFAWMRAESDSLGIDTGRIAVGGQSAGGGLAAALVQRLIDEGVPLAAQWLFCPMLDDRTAADRTRDAEAHFVWNNRSNLVGWRSYLGDRVGADELPAYAVPARRADLSGLPPTWMYASDIELFYAEDRAYAEALRAAGVDVTFDTVPGAPHGFETWARDSRLARGVLSRGRDWLRERLTA